MATNFFEDFPRIAYSLDNFETEQIITDILRRVVLSKEFKDNVTFFETYEVKHGETPEQVSYRFYGTTKLHWLILITNDIIDPRFDWPTSEENLKKLVESKYGGESSIFTAQSAVNNKGRAVETFFLLAEDSSYKNPIRLTFETNDVAFTKQPISYIESATISQFKTNYDIEQDKNESYRNIRIIKPDLVDEIVTNYKNLINQ